MLCGTQHCLLSFLTYVHLRAFKTTMIFFKSVSYRHTYMQTDLLTDKVIRIWAQLLESWSGEEEVPDPGPPLRRRNHHGEREEGHRVPRREVYSGTPTHQAIDCILDLLIVWSIDWLIYRLFDLSIDWFIDWLIDQLIDLSIDWFINWLIYQLIDLSIDWLINWLIYQLIDLSIDWFINWLIYQLIDLSIDWFINWLHHITLHYITLYTKQCAYLFIPAYWLILAPEVLDEFGLGRCCCYKERRHT